MPITLLMEIRRLTIEDYDGLMKLWTSSGLKSLRSKGRDGRGEIEKQMALFPEGFIGAFEGNAIIGAVIASHDGRKGWINRLAVSPERRRRGLARRLARAAEAVLKAQGIKVICALIEDENAVSLDLFRALGYHVHSDIIYVSLRESSED
jgi:ribosomal protein S18 acetylase RimI-like enzyme